MWEKWYRRVEQYVNNVCRLGKKRHAGKKKHVDAIKQKKNEIGGCNKFHVIFSIEN